MPEDKAQEPRTIERGLNKEITTNPGHFGAAVIGKEQADYEATVRDTAAHVYGPAVLHADLGPEVRLSKAAAAAAMPDSMRAALGVSPEQPSFENVAGPGVQKVKKSRAKLGHGYEIAKLEDGRILLFTPAGILNGPVDGAFGSKQDAYEAAGAHAAGLELEFPDATIDPLPQTSGPELVSDAVPSPAEGEAEYDFAGDGVDPDAAIEALIAGASREDGFISAEKLVELAKTEQATIERLLGGELQRPDKPRKTALLGLLEAEQAREGGPRAPIVTAIEKALGEL